MYILKSDCPDDDHISIKASSLEEAEAIAEGIIVEEGPPCAQCGGTYRYVEEQEA